MRITLASCTEVLSDDLDDDLPPLVAALEAREAAVRVRAWDDAAPWGDADLVVVRSAWDYPSRRDDFLAWARSVAGVTRLANPPELLEWTTDKRYLRDLDAAGVPVIATTVVEDPEAGLATDEGEVVVKPAVGAGAVGVGRFDIATQRDAAEAHLEALVTASGAALVQPYVASVDADGELAVVLINGAVSHTFRKGPLLPPGHGPAAGLFAPEDISAAEAPPEVTDVARRAVAAIPGGGVPLYARVDLVRDGDTWRVLELELAEPSLFHRTVPALAEAFADAILRAVTP